jgi:UDP-N-acetylglucosamine 2-epimerase (non-hydrolysing)
MKDTFFTELGIPEPDVDLNVGSGSHAVQTAEIMRRFEPVVEKYQPAMVVVVGDVNSTLACALVAAKLCVPVAHVEAGLRSGDAAMPEEINRLLTDRISNLLFTTERAADANLAAEGVDPTRIRFVGNVMIDTLVDQLKQTSSLAEVINSKRPDSVAIPLADYAVLTLHRPSNVDDPATLRGILAVIAQISQKLPILFAVHPRTQQRLDNLGDSNFLNQADVTLLPPLSYRQMLALTKNARLVLTDSGGLQEETTYLGVPCLTLRENTERPVTVTEGTNQLVGADPAVILSAFNSIDLNSHYDHVPPALWDGKASERIAKEIVEFVQATHYQR